MLTVAIPKRNKLQNIIVLTPKDGIPKRNKLQNIIVLTPKDGMAVFVEPLVIPARMIRRSSKVK